MPSLCGYSWTADIDLAIRDRAFAYGLPLDIAYSFIASESAFNTYVGGDEIIGGVVGNSGGYKYMSGGHFAGLPYQCNGIAWEAPGSGRYYASYGLNQLSTCGGQGVGMTYLELVNPWTNCDKAFPVLADAFRHCWSPSIGQQEFIRCVMRNSGHPGNVPDGDPVFEAGFANIWPKWECFFANLVNLPTVPPPETPPFPTPPLPYPLPYYPPLPQSGNNQVLLIAGIAVASFFIAKSLEPVIFKKKVILPDGTRLVKKLVI